MAPEDDEPRLGRQCPCLAEKTHLGCAGFDRDDRLRVQSSAGDALARPGLVRGRVLAKGQIPCRSGRCAGCIGWLVAWSIMQQFP